MTLIELLAVHTNPEATEEQKAAATAAYEEASKPAAEDKSELEAALESIKKLEAKNKEILDEKRAEKEKADEAARKAMSTDELKADYESRLAKQIKESTEAWEGKYNTVLAQLEKDNVHGKALELAAALSDSPEALLPHIQSRIGFEVSESGFETFVRGADGKRTAGTFDELTSEIKDTPYLKALLKSDFNNPGKQEKRTEGNQQHQSAATSNFLNALN